MSARKRPQKHTAAAAASDPGSMANRKYQPVGGSSFSSITYVLRFCGFSPPARFRSPSVSVRTTYGSEKPLASAEIYNVSSRVWEPVPDMQHWR